MTQLTFLTITSFVQVEDVNDNAPEFLDLPYYAAVQVEAEPGSAIFTVSSTDRDNGLNGEVTYSLKEQNRIFQVGDSSFVLMNEVILTSFLLF